MIVSWSRKEQYITKLFQRGDVLGMCKEVYLLSKTLQSCLVYRWKNLSCIFVLFWFKKNKCQEQQHWMLEHVSSQKCNCGSTPVPWCMGPKLKKKSKIFSPHHSKTPKKEIKMQTVNVHTYFFFSEKIKANSRSYSDH